MWRPLMRVGGSSASCLKPPSDDRLSVMGGLGVLVGMGFDGLQDGGVRQRSDP
jgi:hypothetical protein